MDPLIVSYGDISLYQSNINTLNDNVYLDDSIISFMFEYYEKELFAPLSDIRLIPPTIVKLIADIEDSTYLESALGNHPFPETLVFAPVTDHRGNIAGEGTHWSLLVWNKKTNTFHHFDSSNHSNLYHAEFTATQLYRLCKGQGRTPKVKTEQSITQKNATDCGIFVIAMTYHLICQHKTIQPNFDPFNLTFLRQWIREVIQMKAKSPIRIQ